MDLQYTIRELQNPESTSIVLLNPCNYMWRAVPVPKLTTTFLKNLAHIFTFLMDPDCRADFEGSTVLEIPLKYIIIVRIQNEPLLSSRNQHLFLSF